MCERDIIRFFGGIRFDTVIQYEGYGKNMIHLFQAFSCRKIIFVHNNMLEELATKKNQHRKSLEKAYQDYDRVACVTSSLVPPTEEISGRSDNIYVVHNCHSYLTVREKAEEEIRFDEDTLSTVPLEKLKEILQSKDRKIINIGRFSAEKGHDLLIEAFTRFHKDDPNVWLIIIGGYGQLYEQTLQMAKKSSASERIIVIHSVSNPMPILKRCDLFILSSRYEGLGLTLLEADALDVPVISTNVCGPSGFMKENGGFMVEPTAEGIYKGMIAFEEGKIHPLYVDYAAYNQNAVEQFEQLLQF